MLERATPVSAALGRFEMGSMGTERALRDGETGIEAVGYSELIVRNRMRHVSQPQRFPTRL